METMRPESAANGGDDDEKLIPEWGVRADDQIIWIGLAVFAALLLAFAWNWWRDGDGDLGDAVAPVVEDVTSGAGDDDGNGADGADLAGAAAGAGAIAAPVTEAPASTSTTEAPTTTTTTAPTTTTVADALLGDAEAAVASLAGAITPTVDGRTVTLTGHVANAAEEAEAVAAAGDVDNVDDVINQLVVLEPQVAQALADRGVVDAGVSGAGTVMTITGTVQSEDDRAATIAAAEAIDGVSSVVDQLSVSVAADLNVLPTIPFASGSAEILPEGQAIIDEAAALIAAAGPVSLEVRGYTDITGDDQLNLELSQARAQAVVDALVAAGADQAELTAIGRGETQEFGEGTSPEALAANRVVRFEQTG